MSEGNVHIMDVLSIGYNTENVQGKHSGHGKNTIY